MASPPIFLTIGHVARDLYDDGSFSLGGTVTFAAHTADRLGLAAAIVTRADAEIAALLSTTLPNVSLHVSPSVRTTTFANRYHDGFRTQYLYARAEPLTLADVPHSWLQASIVLFGPLAQEIEAPFVTLFPRTPGMLLAATPQGWLRRWDEAGRVWPVSWQAAERILPILDVLILSHDDLLPFASGDRGEVEAILGHWSTRVPLLVATDGRHGATLFQRGMPQHFPAYAAQEVDPTGAGDVFAAAFLVHLYRHADPARAVDFANRVAAFSVEQPGIQGVPTLAMLEQQWPDVH